MAARTRSTAPLVMPPSMPPECPVGAPCTRPSHQARSRPGRSNRGGRAVSQPSPTSTAFTDWIAHQRAGQPRVEAAIPVHVAAQARRQAVDDDLDDAAQGVARPCGPPSISSTIAALVAGSAQRSGSSSMRGSSSGPRHRPSGVTTGPMPTTWLTTSDADGLPQERCGDRAQRHARGGLACAGPLQDGAGVVEAVLLHAGEIGVPGRGRVSGALRAWPAKDRGVDLVGGHDRRPLRPLGVADLHRDRAALGAAVTDAAGEGDLVLLEPHAGRPGRSRAGGGPVPASRSAVRTSTPAGSPSSTAASRRPCGLTCGQPAQHGHILPSAAESRGSRPSVRRGEEDGLFTAASGTGPARASGRGRADEQRRPERDRGAPPLRPAGGEQPERDDRPGEQAEEHARQRAAPNPPSQQQAQAARAA